MNALLLKVKDLAMKAYAMSPFAAGLVIGYMGKPVIRFVIDLATKLIKFILG